MSKNQLRKIIVLLDQPHVEIISKNSQRSILNPDMHLSIIRKNKLDPSDVRPDILYQCLRVLQESPLNRAGHLKVLIRTKQNKLIEVSNQLKVPNTFEKFCKLMAYLHQNLRVKSKEKDKTGAKRLLKIIKNQLDSALPAGVERIGFSHKAKSIVKPESILSKDKDLVVVIGAMARGSVSESCDFLNKEISISKYPLSGALACAELCNAAAKVWDIENQDFDE